MRRVTMAAVLALALAAMVAGCGNKADTSGGGAAAARPRTGPTATCG